jgi:hypothetical protein
MNKNGLLIEKYLLLCNENTVAFWTGTGICLYSLRAKIISGPGMRSRNLAEPGDIAGLSRGWKHKTAATTALANV